MVIAYSTAPGKTADDGDKLNGLYTEALISQIVTPTISLIEIFQRVRLVVKEKSSGTQIPWESTSLTQNVYLNGTGARLYGTQLISITNHCNAVNARLVFFDKYSQDISDESTEGGEITFYFEGDVLCKIATRLFGESGQMVCEYYLRDSILCFMNECHIRYNRPFNYDENQARESNDIEWFDFKKSLFRTNKYYFDSGKFIVGYDNDDSEIQLSDSKVAGIQKRIDKYQNIFKQRGSTSQ
jgi:hypothetical protein